MIACGVVRNDEGKYLMQRRRDPGIIGADGRWEFPGGKIRFGESPTDAAIRELKEETGITIEISRLIPFIHTNIWQRSAGNSFQVFVLSYLARLVQGTPTPSDPKVSEVGWFTPEEIKTMDTLPGDAQIAAEAEVIA